MTFIVFETAVRCPALASTRDLRLLMPSLTSFIPVTMAEGSHPFPFRTRPLSPPAPMVLSGRPGGRVGRCRDFRFRKEPRWHCRRGFFFLRAGGAPLGPRGGSGRAARPAPDKGEDDGQDEGHRAREDDTTAGRSWPRSPLA